MYICSFVVENSKENLVIEDNVDDSKRDQQTKKIERERETQLHCTRFVTFSHICTNSSKSYFHGNTLQSCGMLDF